MAELRAQRITVEGRVQGVGFRPFVARLARQHRLCGWVRNHSGRVEIHAEGTSEALETFVRALSERAPPLARPLPPAVGRARLQGASGFEIRPSAAGDRVDGRIPPDYFVCDDCLAEMHDPAQRRHRHPFINCTQCGPRYTLIDRLPYDRANTAMAAFEMCPACRAEYHDPDDRRYHAQPLACPDCGPRLAFRTLDGNEISGNEPALAATLAALRAGSIVAVKGVGGYHLLCSASDQAVVDRLRQRKQRPGKPLAVLVPWLGPDGLAAVREIATPNAAEREWLASPLRPIVLVRKRADSGLAPGIAPGLSEVGVMLPSSPLHHLLCEGYGAPLVATSGNISGEPVLTANDEVEARLGRVVDAFLHHDRPIRRPADDAVFRCIDGLPRPMRLGRGNAPAEHPLPFVLPEPVIALGADLKNTIALAFDDRIVISPHIGELGSVRSERVFEQVIDDLQRLYGIRSAHFVCDAHPGYRSVHWARSRTRSARRVFHHHAHASALAGEHGAMAEDTLVFTWDGLGYGEDGSLWGGEALLGRPGAWRRMGTLRPFRLPGGDRASREPWRCALALCWEHGTEWSDCPQPPGLLRHAWERGLNCPSTHSVGRLFDAAAALTGIATTARYEAEAAMQLEAIASDATDLVELPIAPSAAAPWTIDWAPLLGPLMDTQRSSAARAALFHASLAKAIADVAEHARRSPGIQRVGLTGGVFQNRLLTEQAIARLRAAGFEVMMPIEIPGNDAGIAFGQIIETGADRGTLRDSASWR